MELIKNPLGCHASRAGRPRRLLDRLTYRLTLQQLKQFTCQPTGRATSRSKNVFHQNKLGENRRLGWPPQCFHFLHSCKTSRHICAATRRRRQGHPLAAPVNRDKRISAVVPAFLTLSSLYSLSLSPPHTWFSHCGCAARRTSHPSGSRRLQLGTAWPLAALAAYAKPSAPNSWPPNGANQHDRQPQPL